MKKKLLLLLGVILILAIVAASVSAATSAGTGRRGGVWCYIPGPPDPPDFDFSYRIGVNDFFTGSYDSEWRGTFTGLSQDNGLVIWRNFPADGPSIFVDLIAFESVKVEGKTGGLELYLYGEREYDYWDGNWFSVDATGDLAGMESRGKWWQWDSRADPGCPDGYLGVHYSVDSLHVP